MILALLASMAYAVDGDQLAAAMDIPSADIVGATYTGESTMAAVAPGMGILTPPEGANMVLLYTGSMALDGYGYPLMSPEGGPTDRPAMRRS